MFDIFQPNSNGNFYHFEKLVEYFLMRHPVQFLDTVLLAGPEKSLPLEDCHSASCSSVEKPKPLIFQSIPYLYESPVMSAVIKILTWRSIDDAPSNQLQKHRLEDLLQEDFLDLLWDEWLVELPSRFTIH